MRCFEKALLLFLGVSIATSLIPNLPESNARLHSVFTRHLETESRNVVRNRLIAERPNHLFARGTKHLVTRDFSVKEGHVRTILGGAGSGRLLTEGLASCTGVAFMGEHSGHHIQVRILAHFYTNEIGNDEAWGTFKNNWAAASFDTKKPITIVMSIPDPDGEKPQREDGTKKPWSDNDAMVLHDEILQLIQKIEDFTRACVRPYPRSGMMSATLSVEEDGRVIVDNVMLPKQHDWGAAGNPGWI
ncbi:hypothetical protein CC86DRAFT_408592 [Ophiobolus disseminans]|uniref:Uncharacterized protein n=1 Tax=Ophiobolus disseminans TaxID=1469910 RepID=A0A6A6ZUU5_9PLEO|nr:hypothetical protein CC86DRAFT_408592 [Ophiobolus disseminans]